MAYDKCLLRNVIAVSNFEGLQQLGKNPVFGVYRGRSLLVISHKTDSVLERISQVLKRVVFCLLECFGLLNKSSTSIQELKNEVSIYHYEQVKKDKNAELSGLEKTHQTARQVLMDEHSQLKSQCQLLEQEKVQISAEAAALSTNKDKILQNFNAIAEDYAEAKVVLHQKQKTEAELKELSLQKNLLESQISALEITQMQLAPAKKELEEVNVELKRVQSDLSQGDFKAQVAGLKKKISNLGSEIAWLRYKVRQAGISANS